MRDSVNRVNKFQFFESEREKKKWEKENVMWKYLMKTDAVYVGVRTYFRRLARLGVTDDIIGVLKIYVSNGYNLIYEHLYLSSTNARTSTYGAKRIVQNLQ